MKRVCDFRNPCLALLVVNWFYHGSVLLVPYHSWENFDQQPMSKRQRSSDDVEERRDDVKVSQKRG